MMSRRPWFLLSLVLLLALVPIHGVDAGQPEQAEQDGVSGMPGSLEEAPDPIMYVTRLGSRVSSLPRWVASDAAAYEGQLSADWFSEPSLRAVDYFTSRPEEPETGCTVVDPYYDLYGEYETPESAIMIARVKILQAEPGFGWGAPGTLFRARVLEMVRSPERHQDRQILDFFAPVGRVPLGDKVLCPRDPRFVTLVVGDEAILLVHQLYEPNETLVSIGDGGVLGIRNGELIPEGRAFERMDVAAVTEALELVHNTESRPRVDGNHDGISQPFEILATRDVGLYAIRALAAHSMKRDAFGNWPKWWAPAYFRRNESGFVVQTTDVFFVHASE